MIDIANKKLEFNKIIYENLPIIKEVFCLYYGEKYRDLVEERFSDVTYIGYCFPEHISELLDEIFICKSRELISKFFIANGIFDNDDNLVKYFGNVYVDLSKFKDLGLYKIYKYLDGDEGNSKEFFLYDLRKFSNDNDFSLDGDEGRKFIEFIVSMKNSFFHMISEFEEFRLQYCKYINYINDCNELKKKINEKYFFKFLEDINFYLSDRDKDLIKSRNVFSNFDYTKLDCFGIFVGFDYSDSTLIDAFNSYNNELISNEDTSRKIIEDIYASRINYFKKLGIDLGDNYQMYINNSRCLEVMPTCHMADTISFNREILSMEEREEYITSTSSYVEQLRMIEELQLLDKNISYNYLELDDYVTCVNPNVIRYGDGYKRYSLLLFPMLYYYDNFDHFFNHECNHLFETKLVNADSDGCKFIIGWDVLETKYNSCVNLDDIFKMREFELFNEIINDLLAQDITNMMHEMEIFLFDDKNNWRVGGSVYERVKFLAYDFFEDYKEEIIDSRVNGNMFGLFKRVGYQNFMRLNKLINDYGERFLGFRKYSLDEDLENNVMSEDVLYYYEAIRIRDEILNDIRQCSIKRKERIVKYYM